MRRGGRRLDVAVGVSVATLVFMTMYVAIAPRVAQDDGKRFYAPDPVSFHADEATKDSR